MIRMMFGDEIVSEYKLDAVMHEVITTKRISFVNWCMVKSATGMVLNRSWDLVIRQQLLAD